MTTEEGHQAVTDVWVKTAVEFSAGKAFAGDLPQARRALRQGRCEVCEYLRYSLAGQVADYLGMADPMVKAVYLFEAEAPVGFDGAAPVRQPSGINLIAWVERKTAALAALTKALEASLAASRRALGCSRAAPACFFLDVHLVDDADVQERRGYGVLVSSLHVEPMKVWGRAEVPAN
jgi:hypothetical protein